MLQLQTKCLLLALTISACYSSLAAPAVAQDPSAIARANTRLGRGINLGNFLEVPRTEDWSIKLELNHLTVIKKAGFDSIRLPVKWSDYAAKEPPYTVEPAFVKRVDQWIDRAEREGLNVVLNIHHYDGLDQDPSGHRERFASLWKQIAEHYQQRGEFLYFELDNEPHEKLSDVWNDVLKVGLAAVRASNPTRPVIIGPPFWNGIWALNKLQLPDDPNLIVTVHMYNPHRFTHQGASWAEEKVRNTKDLKWGSAEDQQALEKEMDQAAQWSQEHQRPIYLGEFGAFDAAPHQSRVAWTRAVVEAAEKRSMSWAYWEFGAGFGAYSLQDGKWHDDLLQALIATRRVSK